MNQPNKKLVIFTFLCLVLVASCSHNPALEDRYNAEKMLNNAENMLKETQAFNSSLPEQKLTELSAEFNKIVDFCYAALDKYDSTKYPIEVNQIGFITYQSVIRLSQLYYSHQKYSQSVEITEKLLNNVSIPRDYQSNVYINLGQALQAAGNWDSAYAVFSGTLERFSPPLTNTGKIITPVMYLPLYIFRTVRFTESPQQVSYQLNKTEQYYIDLLVNADNTKLRESARENLAKLYEETGQWEKELEQLEDMLDPSAESYNDILMKQADILGGKLKMFDSALTIYDFIFARTKPEDSDTRANIYFNRSLIDLAKGNYSSSRDWLNKIEVEYRSIYHREPLFQYNLAKSFELENNWERAEQEYNLLLEKFKGSSESMMTLLYLVDRFKKLNQTKISNYWFESAQTYFEDIAKINRGEELEARALLYSADLFKRAENYTKSSDILLEIYNKFPKSPQGRQALYRAIRLNNNELKDTNKADSLLNLLKANLAGTIGSAETEDLFEN
ncbi:MAG: hypothetical protein DWP97_06065 [Calditrichaeota bacterium]|nr:MAG: hypothetical protein DWP97_06065 [Calditrichota bacterium]